jgi:hypothetical protein
MRDFILIDFLIEKIKKIFVLLENHNHDNLYVRKEDLEVETFIKQTPNRLTFDYRIKDGNNAVVSGPFEIANGVTLEIPKGSVLSVI